MCGEPIEPADKITSLFAATSIILPLCSYLTPTAFLPSSITLCTKACVITVKLLRDIAGRKYAFAVEARTPLLTVMCIGPKPSC